MSERTGSSGPGLLAPAGGTHVQDRLQQASDRAAYLSRVARGLSGALHTDRAVDLVLEMLVGPVVDWAQLTLLDRHAHRFRCRDLEGRLRLRPAAGRVDPRVLEPRPDAVHGRHRPR